MKEVVSVAIGNKSFTLETDAYALLKDYLEAFRTRSSAGIQSRGDSFIQDFVR